MIDELIGHVALEEGNDYRKNIFSEAVASPDKILYRVVKNRSGEIVGFMHCTKGDEYNELGGLYLLKEAKGSGIGGKLMEEFLSWADKNKPCQLGVFSLNENAIGFYARYGFIKSNKPLTPHKGKLEQMIMVRPANNA